MMKRPAGLSLFLPPSGLAGPRTRRHPRLVSTPAAISASLSAEDDYEISGAFLDAFQRTGERLLGFCVGCLAVAALWMVASAI